MHDQNADGGWGGGTTEIDNDAERQANESSVEETALATEALLADPSEPTRAEAAEAGTAWLVRAVESDRHRCPSPIGFYFAKLWYYEDLYPLVFTVSSLRRYLEGHTPDAGRTAITASAHTA